MGGKGSGGANGGPQYNPNNISATGGAGQSGRNYSGFAYGENKKINEQKKSAKLASTPRPMNIPPAALNDVTPITAETSRPGEDVLTGLTPYGQPNNPIALGLPAQAQGDDPDLDLIRINYPMMEAWANMPGASKATKDAVRYLGTIL